jgi:hypothetical protein
MSRLGIRNMAVGVYTGVIAELKRITNSDHREVGL